MKIIKNVLYIVFLLCISNVFAMQNKIPVAIDQNKEGLYVFKDGVFCYVRKGQSIFGGSFIIGIGKIQENGELPYELYSSKISYQKCFEQHTEQIKDYVKEDIILFSAGFYTKMKIKNTLRNNNIFQKIEENRKKEKDTTVTPEEEKFKKNLGNAKIKIQANMRKNLIFTSMIVGSILVFILYLMYKKNKAKQNNKTDDLAKAMDEAAEEEDDTLTPEELKEEIKEKFFIEGFL